jgi:hypothetical protein
MDYRGWVHVPGIDVEGDEAGRLLKVLEQRHGSYGPVLSGAGDGLDVIVSVACSHETEASALMLGAVTEALIAGGFSSRPSAIEVERSEGIGQPA